MDFSEHELRSIYSWVDELSLSRPKRNIHRDFADGVLMAEIIALYMPKIVNLHNYSGCSAMHLKLYNWHTLNERAFRKLGCALPAPERRDCAAAKPGAIEHVLRLFQRLLQDRALLPEIEAGAIWPYADRQPETCKGLSAHSPGSPTSQLEAVQQELSSPGSGTSGSGVLRQSESAGAADREAHPAEACSEMAGHAEDPTMAGDVPPSRDCAESIATGEQMKGLEGMTDMSVELVEGALGESADFLISTYSMGAAHKDALKPIAFRSSSGEAGPDKPAGALALQERGEELERRVAELEEQNERLRRILSLHQQRCCILEEACLANGVHIPGGLIAHQHG